MLSPGAEIGGFRIESVIARGSSSVVYEATQLDFDRRVALKVSSHGSIHVSGPEHPNVVAVYTAGTSPHGEFVAMQLVPGGRTLKDRVPRRRRRSALRDVAAALAAAHAAGLVHGALAPETVLLGADGRAFLSGFRPGSAEEAAVDLAALATLGKCGAVAPRLGFALVSALGVGALAAGVIVFRGHAHGPLPVLPGTVVLGSALSAPAVESLDCTGAAVSGASPACSVAQTALAGRTVLPRRAGVIRRWTVRGAKGDLALEVLHPYGPTYITAARTPYVTISDRGVHTLPANLPVQPGDLVGLEVAPGSAVGVHRDARGAQTARWFGPLVYGVRGPERQGGTGFDHELLLRVEYEPGATFRIEGELDGRAAALAPAGQVVRREAVQGGVHEQVLSIARLGERVVVDLANDGRRVVRVTLSGADAAGKPGVIEIRRVRLGLPIVRVTWLNDDVLVTHEYVVGRQSLALLD